MHIPLIQDIVVILGLSVIVLLIFQKVKIPPIVGFLITGTIAGPYGLSLINAPKDVEILAEVGVILLLFLIGMEFSLKNLSTIKKAVYLGGSVQVLLTIATVCVVTLSFGYNTGESIFLGFLLSLSSTAIVLKLLQEKGEINSPHGKISLAILIFQDIIVVPMMLFTPMLTGETENVAYELFKLALKGAFLILLVYISAKYIVPKLLFHIAKTKSKELFLLTIVVICFSVAWVSSSLGLSLALGAFLAGLIISESEYHYEATADILPFREIFTSFFFVSIGMLMDASFLIKNFPYIFLFIVITFILKGGIASASAWILRYPLRTVALVGMSLFQVGEFAFILSRTGLQVGLLDQVTYQYFLSVSILTMILTPFVIKYSNTIYFSTFGKIMSEKAIDKVGALRDLVQKKQSEEYEDHIVIIGYGINGKNVARAAKKAKIPYIIIELNAETVRGEKAKGEPIMYGDAVKSNILSLVNIHKARVAVIAISDPEATKRILNNIKNISTKVHTIIRTRFLQEMEQYYKLGADEVIPEEFETSIEIFSRVLHKYLVPQNEIEAFVKEIRSDNYEMLRPMPTSQIRNIKIELPNIDIATLTVQKGKNEIIGKLLQDSHIRRDYGITIVAIKRNDEFIKDIHGGTQVLTNDILYVFGNPQQIFEFNKKIKI
jgi:CPA2 family monovalent cation:H+ antiporter-2